jgi:hypothetical protein
MSNGAWVCFDCRNAVRRSNQFKGEVPCADCGKPREYIGYKIPVPPKSKEKEWKQLFEQHFASKCQKLVEIEKERVKRQHSLEQEITRLEAMPENPGRARAIGLLRKQLLQYQS